MAEICAWNRNRRVWVKWLGCTETVSEMNTRLRKFDAPSHVVARRIPKSTAAKWRKR